MPSPAAVATVRSEFGPHVVVPAGKSVQYGPFRTLQAADRWGQEWFEDFVVLPLTKPFKRP